MDMNYWVFVDAVIPDVTAFLLLIELLCGISVFQLLKKANNSLLTGGKNSIIFTWIGTLLDDCSKKTKQGPNYGFFESIHWILFKCKSIKNGFIPCSNNDR